MLQVFFVYILTLGVTFSFVFKIVTRKKVCKRRYMGTENYNHNVGINYFTGIII